MNLEEIKISLTELKDIEIQSISDNSFKHRGHSEVKASENIITHIQIYVLNVVSISKIEIHRKIYKNLNKFILQGLHSIEINIIKL